MNDKRAYNWAAVALKPYAGRALHALLLGVIAWLALIVVSAATAKSPEFDGAMNLLVSRSIAEGHGPREVYDSGDLFPAGVQSKEPFILVGALVFKAFGVGPLQVQVPNLIYLALLGSILAYALRRIFDVTTATVGVLLLLASPYITQYALRGYGEIPTMFFGVAALLVVAWPHPDWRARLARRCAVAGALAGLAVATKVVGVVLVAVTAVVLIARLVVEGRSWRTLIVGSASFAAGVAAPLLLVELWRWYWLGSTEYQQWWNFQLLSIRSQSGAEPLQVQAALPAKIAHHLGILRNQLGFGSIATRLFLLAPLLSLAFTYLAVFSMEQRRHCRWFLLGLVLLVLFYFPWWLAIVPSEKAWLRYIYIGLIALAMIASVALVANVRMAFTGGSRPLLRATGGSLMVVLFGLYGSLAVKALQAPISFGKDEETRRTLEAAQLISHLPEDAAVLAFGWYAAPSVQIHTQRPFMDLTDWPIGRLAGRPAYVVADRPSLVTGILNRVLARYPNRPLLQANRFAQVYAVDFANPVNPFGLVNPERTASHVTFSEGEYPYTAGMEPFNPVGGRFIESDSEILLRYGGERTLQLVGYMDAAQPTHYRWIGPLEGRVILGSCPPMPFRFEQPGWRDLRLPLSCRPPQGQPVRVRILLDNVFDWPLLLKDRQRAMLLAAIGFLGETPTQ